MATAQCVHVMNEFSIKNKLIFDHWYNDSNYICILAVENEAELIDLIEKAKDITFSLFREPDLDNEITAIALEPGKVSKKLCQKLSLLT